MCGWSAPRSCCFTPGKAPKPIVQKAGWFSRPVWMGTENLVHTGIRSPGRPSRSDSLYRLHHPVGHYGEAPVGILSVTLVFLEEILRGPSSVPKTMLIYYVLCRKSSSTTSTNSPTNRLYTSNLGY